MTKSSLKATSSQRSLNRTSDVLLKRLRLNSLFCALSVRLLNLDTGNTLQLSTCLAACFPNTRNTPPPMEEDNSLNPPRSSAVYLHKAKRGDWRETGRRSLGGKELKLPIPGPLKEFCPLRTTVSTPTAPEAASVNLKKRNRPRLAKEAKGRRNPTPRDLGPDAQASRPLSSLKGQDLCPTHQTPSLGPAGPPRLAPPPPPAKSAR